MFTKRRIAIGFLVFVAGAWAWRNWGEQAEFVMGGAMINAGYRLQDRLAAFDFEHGEHLTPPQVFDEFMKQNRMASSVRHMFPRTVRHPLLALVVCMDGRLDTNEIAGDSRRYYYVLRLAGSALSPKEEDMLELAVANGVKVVVFTTHTDCAAEKAAKDQRMRGEYPDMVRAVEEREMRLQEFLLRPRISAKIGRGELLVKRMKLNTADERAEHDEDARAALAP